MSLRAELLSTSEHTRKWAALKLLARVERLEQLLAARPGTLIGETEHGDRVYAVGSARPDGDATTNAVAAAIKTNLGV